MKEVEVFGELIIPLFNERVYRETCKGQMKKLVLVGNFTGLLLQCKNNP